MPDAFVEQDVADLGRATQNKIVPRTKSVIGAASRVTGGGGQTVLITIILTLGGLALGALLSDPLLYGILGFLLGRVIALDLALDLLERETVRLRLALTSDRERRHVAEHTEQALQAAEQGAGGEALQVAEPVVGRTVPVSTTSESARPSGAPQVAAPSVATEFLESPAAAAPTPADPAPVFGLVDRFRDWLQSGNLFVRVGILLLFLGVGFLIKYAVDRELLVFTKEMRLAAVAAGGGFLLILGWVLRKRRREYALLLQGAAFGILYLDIYGAYQLYQLIPSEVAFTLLFLTGLSAAFMAILQDARALAWFGFAGGFLAPIVASGGSDDHVVLFSYYALLNAAILAVAWFKSWRALNLLGFAFTYGVAGVWGVLRYDPSRFSTTEPFLALFFLFFVAIAVLYAVRQPPRFRGYIDASLLFGTPILTIAYQIELVRQFEYGIAWSAAVMGAFYLLLALAITRSEGKGLRLLAQAFLALGVVFLSLAVPFALGAAETAAAWALEGAGLVWIGARQRLPGARAFGLLLQAGAAAALVVDFPGAAGEAFLNGFYLGAAMIGIGGLFSAYWLDRDYPDKRSWEYGSAPLLLLWALAWWFGTGGYELVRFYPAWQLPAGILIYTALTVLAMEVVASLRRWDLLHLVEIVFPLAGIAALAASLGVLEHPAEHGGAWVWPMFFAAVWFILFRVERRDPHRLLSWGHAAGAIVLAAVLEWEVTWRLTEQAGWIEGWHVAAFALVPVVLLQLVTRLGGWPLARWRIAYALVLGSVLATVIALWGIFSVQSPGGAAPFPWLPLLNPLDLMLAMGVVTLFQWWISLKERFEVNFQHDQERLVWVFLGALAFLWANVVLLRAIHHWWGIDYAPGPLFRSEMVQMAISVLWGLTGVILLLAARWRSSRGLWIAGAVVLAAAVIKLFLVDLSASGTVERIVSFLAIGGLLVGIGWFSPLPPRAARQTERMGEQPGSD